MVGTVKLVHNSYFIARRLSKKVLYVTIVKNFIYFTKKSGGLKYGNACNDLPVGRGRGGSARDIPGI